MNISLPDSLKQFIEEQVNAGGYNSAGEYVRELLRAEQKRIAKEQLEKPLLAALRSGQLTEVSPAMWEELRRNIRLRGQAGDSSQP